MPSLPPLGCPYPRCPSHHGVVPEATEAPQGIRLCSACGRLMVVCHNRSCQASGTFNRPFVKFCRRCGEPVKQGRAWEALRRDGWDLVPQGIAEPEIVADLSRLIQTHSPRYLVAQEMIRGMLAIHHAGQSLALTKAVPGDLDEAILWSWAEDPFPESPFGGPSPPNTPTLLPDERRLMFSCPQGVLLLDLWSCHGISAKDNAARVRVLRLSRRSLVVPPIPLDPSRIGLLSRGPGESSPYRWTIWDIARPESEDASVASELNSEAGALLPIGLGTPCRREVVADRAITLTTPKAQFVWKMADAIEMNVAEDKLVRTWPGPEADPEDTIVLDDRGEFQTAAIASTEAMLLHEPTAEMKRRGLDGQFSWFYCVRSDRAASLESAERYECYQVPLDSLRFNIPQPVQLPSGARPVGAVPDRNDIPRMIFHFGPEIWSVDEANMGRMYQGGLPSTPVSHQSAGPLILSVGEQDHRTRFVQIDSLHHPARRTEAVLGGRLVSDPLLWHRWLFTIEIDGSDRLLARRRIVQFGAPNRRAASPGAGDLESP